MTKADWLSLASTVAISLAPIAAGAFIVALGKLAQVFHLQVSQAQESRYEDLVMKAIAYVQEVSATKSKAGLAMSSGAKLSMAVQFIVQRIGEKPEHVEADIQSALGATGQGAAVGPITDAIDTHAIGFHADHEADAMEPEPYSKK